MPTAGAILKESVLAFLEQEVPVGHWTNARTIRLALRLGDAACSATLRALHEEGLIERQSIPKNPKRRKAYRDGGPMAPYFYRALPKCIQCGSTGRDGKPLHGCPRCGTGEEE